jgi:hypothetical protein
MFDRPDEWRGFYVLVWDDGTIEPVLFKTEQESRDFWAEASRTSSAQTLEVVVRERRTDQDLEIKSGKLPAVN